MRRKKNKDIIDTKKLKKITKNFKENIKTTFSYWKSIYAFFERLIILFLGIFVFFILFVLKIMLDEKINGGHHNHNTTTIAFIKKIEPRTLDFLKVKSIDEINESYLTRFKKYNISDNLLKIDLFKKRRSVDIINYDVDNFIDNVCYSNNFYDKTSIKSETNNFWLVKLKKYNNHIKKQISYAKDDLLTRKLKSYYHKCFNIFESGNIRIIMKKLNDSINFHKDIDNKKFEIMNVDNVYNNLMLIKNFMDIKVTINELIDGNKTENYYKYAYLEHILYENLVYDFFSKKNNNPKKFCYKATIKIFPYEYCKIIKNNNKKNIKKNKEIIQKTYKTPIFESCSSLKKIKNHDALKDFLKYKPIYTTSENVSLIPFSAYFGMLYRKKRVIRHKEINRNDIINVYNKKRLVFYKDIQYLCKTEEIKEFVIKNKNKILKIFNIIF